jgi:predicted nucleic acid-binding protein
MTLVVCDASPVMNLAAIDRLELLQKLFEVVLMPPSVWAEIVAGDPLDRPAWIELHSPTNPALVESLSLDLDVGEAEAIALASEIAADLLLIDEKKGRAFARRLGLRPLGLLGVLAEAKSQGLVEAVKPLLDALVCQAGFRVGASLYRQVLDSVGE